MLMYRSRPSGLYPSHSHQSQFNATQHQAFCQAMAQPSSDRLLSSTDRAEASDFFTLDTEEKIINPNMSNSHDVVPIGRRDTVDQSSALASVGYQKMGCVSNDYSFHPPLLYNGSYDNAAGKQGAYLPYINNAVLESGSYGIHNESPSVGLPVTAQLTASNHGHLYNARQFSTYDPFSFRQNISPSSYILSPTPVPQAKLPVPIDLQVDSKRSHLRPNYVAPLGSSSRGTNSFGNSDGLALLHQGFEGSEVGGLWSDWLSPSDGKSCMLQLSLPPTSLEPIGSLEKGSFYGFGSCSGSSYTGYSHRQSDQASDYGSLSTSSIRMDGQIWPTLTEARQWGRCNDFSCSCSVTLDMLSEQNRGPRAFKPKIWTTVNGSAVGNSKNCIIGDLLGDSYNRSDFITSYKDAKFFIIKSYSEDNVHKSIKYGVWASTPNGNKKLDYAYHEAKEKDGMCPIFLLFSVNASAQFCGVTEMVGPVDFDKNVDYWLQDKWSGQFPVKWHIIKDVPNSQFRHILLKNNENKPATNSRDTQEVEMEPGMEMLNIFKNYEPYSSILDDFSFYEKRQKAIQERKAGPQVILMASPVAVSEQQILVSPSADSVKRMSKSFVEAVSLTEHEKEHSAAGKVVLSATTSVAHGS
ncbi:YTH domain-containing protein ECT1-like isoform X2 [Mangifera indica]|uniref:YTH domain-containing protein ECT1-like isoform X2 n=1 Tax=Mangifera indica TaxID=29780 RepID=UPI001CF9D1A0|nr:YTH domain-containing protein ECT1-like isoform X2 [Mangifera indica]